MNLPAGQNDIVDLIITLAGSATGSEVVVIVTCFVDEAGTGDEPNIVLAALVSDLAGWAAFNPAWQEHLNDSVVDYAHFKELRKGEGPFEGWTVNRKQLFTQKALRVVKDHCWFGLTVTLDKKLYREKYLADFPKGIAPDSAYAVCARLLFGFVLRDAEEYWGYGGPMNFIFEDGHRNSANAAAVFQDLKRHSQDRDRLGFFTLADKKRTLPLQGADQIASSARRQEATALERDDFKKIRRKAYKKAIDAGELHPDCPIYYYPIAVEMLEHHRNQQVILRGLKRRAKGASAAG